MVMAQSEHTERCGTLGKQLAKKSKPLGCTQWKAAESQRDCSVFINTRWEREGLNTKAGKSLRRHECLLSHPLS